MQSFTILSRSPEDTAVIARAVALDLRAGDVLLLNGDLAAGKTHFVKALAAALGSSDTVTSPTFSIANFYARPGGRILHMDAYRLGGVAEFRDLALDEYFETAITVVEWGERVADAVPACLSIAFEIDDAQRRLTFTARGARWADALPILARRLGAA